MAPDEIRRLSEDKIIIIPERQFPIMAHRIKWYEDPTFAPMVKGQSGDLPYPQLSARDFFALREEVRAMSENAAKVIKHSPETPAPLTIGKDAANEEFATEQQDIEAGARLIEDAAAKAEAAMIEVSEIVAEASGMPQEPKVQNGASFEAYLAKMRKY